MSLGATSVGEDACASLNPGGEAPVITLRGTTLHIPEGFGAYLAYPIATEQESPPYEQLLGQSESIDLSHVVGPVLEVEPHLRGIIPFPIEGGLPYPIYLADLLPCLKTVNAGGFVMLLNPFYELKPGEYPPKIRLTGWRVGWDRGDVESLVSACKSGQEYMVEWARRVELWGDRLDYQFDFFMRMRDRLSALIDLAKSLGMVFDGGILAGFNFWPKESISDRVVREVSQTLLDTGRLCADLNALGYVTGIPLPSRPAGTDRLMADRLTFITEQLQRSLETITRKERELSPCELDILTTLRETGHRLTTNPLITEMRSRKRDHGESTIKIALARLASDGKLTNRQEVRPRGYGLPEWDSAPA